jgi:hypothetical protein
MGLRDRLEEQAARAGDHARAVAASERVRLAGESFRGFRAMLTDNEREPSIEVYLLALVRAVRDDERDEKQASHDVYVRARKRRRRLGLISFGAGPMVGVASRVADLYCETATVCDVADLHGLDLSDEQVAAHMLVLWSITEDFARAEGAMRGEPPVAEILGAKLFEYLDLELEAQPTKLAIVKAIWEVQRLNPLDVADDAKKAVGGQPIRSVAFTGHRTKKVIKKAEAQLGVSPERSRRLPWR